MRQWSALADHGDPHEGGRGVTHDTPPRGPPHHVSGYSGGPLTRVGSPGVPTRPFCSAPLASSSKLD